MSTRPCRTCGAAIPYPPGRAGRPRLYCHEHAPRFREAIRRWQAANAEHVREYQRSRHGYRPTIAAICQDCSAAFRTYIGSPFCHDCRARERLAAARLEREPAALGATR